MALKPLDVPVRQEVGDLDLVVPAAARTSKGNAVTVFAQRGRVPVHSAELVITDPADRARVAGLLAANGEAEAVERALLTLSFSVENALRERETKKPAKEKAEVQGQALHLEDVEPWPDEVDGAAVLAELRDVFNRYLVLPEGAAVIFGLWTLHTYLVECFDHTPYLAITSPVKRSGKTTTIHVVKAHVRRALSADNVSPAVLFRVIELAAPTLLVDELDRLQPDSDVWGVLNSGHTRGGSVLRTVGETHEPRAFGTYCPKLLAYIRPARSPVPDTVEDRSIRVMLQRRGRGEQREKLRSRELEATAAPLRRKLARWAEDHQGTMAEARPAVPDELDDRAADSWEPLLALADLAGGDWPETARALAVRYSADRAEEEAEAPGVLLLLDLGALLDSGELKADELGIESKTMVGLLKELPDRPWRTWGRAGTGLTEAGLARLLKPFGIRSEMVGPRNVRLKRYDLAALRAAADRFKPGERVGETAQTLSPSHRPENHPISDSTASSVRVRGLEPLTGGDKRDTEPLTEDLVITPATTIVNLDVERPRHQVGDRLPDGRVVLEVDEHGVPIIYKKRPGGAE